MGMSLGTLAGVGAAFMNLPAAGTVSQNSAANTQTVSSPAATPASSPRLQLAAVEVPRSGSEASNASSDQTAVSQPTPEGVSVHRPAKVETKPAVEEIPAKEPAAERNAVPDKAPKEKHRVAHPLTRPVRTEMASEADTTLDELAEVVEPQPAPQEEAKVSAFYTEGDLQIEDYDATEGTIETSDGRTFAVGTSVSLSSTASGDENHSNVHYRCGDDGNCVLQTAGAAAVNARQI
jgi:hypothetical protein